MGGLNKRDLLVTILLAAASTSSYAQTPKPKPKEAVSISLKNGDLAKQLPLTYRPTTLKYPRRVSRNPNLEKLHTASQSLFGFNQNGNNGGFSGGQNGFTPVVGQNGFNTGGTFGSGGINGLYQNQLTNGLGTGGFGQTGFGQNGFFQGNRFNNGLYNGFGGNQFLGNGFGNPFGNGFGGFNGFNNGGFNQFSGFGQQGLFQNGGQTTDRNLGFVNQGFGNPLYNTSPPGTSVQPNLGTLQVGNRINVNPTGNQGFNYVPNVGNGGFTSNFPSNFNQQQQQYSPFGFGGGFNGYYPQGYTGGQFSGIGRGVGLRGPTDGSTTATRGSSQGSSGSGNSSPNSLGEGSAYPTYIGNRLLTTGPNRYYQGTNPAGAFRRERIHRFTSSSETP